MLNEICAIGLTGGIATGKSTCVQIFQELVPDLILFDADACVKTLYTRSDVQGLLRQYFGNSVIGEDGVVNKTMLRERVFLNSDDKKIVESVFHPLVREECLALFMKTAHREASPLFVADVPLLFEGGFDFGQSANVLVATTKQTQIDRLIERNKWDMKTVQSALASQLPIDDKYAMADIVFWNEGPQQLLQAQCRRFLQTLSISC